MRRHDGDAGPVGRSFMRVVQVSGSNREASKRHDQAYRQAIGVPLARDGSAQLALDSGMAKQASETLPQRRSLQRRATVFPPGDAQLISCNIAHDLDMAGG